MTLARNISHGFSTAAGLLFFLWLIRYLVGLAAFNLELAEGFLLFLLLARILYTETSRGPIRAVASLFGRIAGFFIITWLFLIIGGNPFFGLTPVLTAYTTQALLAAIITGIVAIILRNVRKGEVVELAESPFVNPPERIVSDSNISAELTRDSMLLRIKRGGRTYGYIGQGEIAINLNTNIGEVKRTISGTFALTGVGVRRLSHVRGWRATNDSEAKRFGYENLSAFKEKCNSIYESLEPRLRFGRTGFWPFVQVEESPEGERVHIPFVDVERTSAGERVKIAGITVADEDHGRLEVGPISIEADEGRRRRWRRQFGWYTILGFNGERIRIESRGQRVEMHSEEYLLTVDHNSTSLRRGPYSIALSENYASFHSPSIRAEVSQDGWATFRAADIYGHLSGERIRLESKGTEKVVQNRELSLQLYKKIADIVSQASAAISSSEQLDETPAEAFAKELRDLMAKS